MVKFRSNQQQELQEKDTINKNDHLDTKTKYGEEIRPSMRGKIHRIAFYKTLLLLAVFVYISIVRRFVLGVLIYILSQLILYGTSSTYHTFKFRSERMKRVFQRLDHSSIFLLISGTQTSVFLTCIRDLKTSSKALITTWIISLIGITKVVAFSTIVELLDVIIYIVHGVCVVPFFHILIKNLSSLYILLFIAGGALYIIGGIIFGVHLPNPAPKIFGYHEIFHLLTVLANICFAIPIFCEYYKICWDQTS